MPHFDLSTIDARAALAARDKAYWDLSTDNRHLGLVVRSAHVWVARCRHPGNCYLRKTLASAEPYPGGISYAEAMSRAQEWFAECDAHEISKPPQFPRYRGKLSIVPTGDVFTIGHALRDYVAWKKMVAAPTHFRTNLVLVNYHIVPRLAHVPVESFNHDNLNAFCIDVLETPPKRGVRACGPKRPISSLTPEELRKRKKTLNALIGILRLAFELALDNGRIASDRPRRCLKSLPNYDRPRLLFLNSEQVHRLLALAEDSLKLLILGALYTGCRVTELRDLLVGDVAQQCHGIHIRRAKNYQSRHVILPDEGMAFFLAQCAGKSDDAQVFTNRQGRRWGDHYKTLFKRAVLGAGLDRELVFHSLRHTYASQLLQNGGTLATLARQLGHANINTVYQIYGHLTGSNTLQELDRCFMNMGAASEADIVAARSKVAHLRQAATQYVDPDAPAWPRSNFAKHAGKLATLGKPLALDIRRS
ncbi:MAG: tyrosine-type recombinase/integrase [Hyphomicrobiales bacterium]